MFLIFFMYRILKQIQYFYVMMDPPCSMHFLSNKSISSLARLAFSIDPATLFFDNSHYSNVHSTAMEFKALNIFFNDFDEFFCQFFAFVEHYIITNSCFPLKNLFESLKQYFQFCKLLLGPFFVLCFYCSLLV